MRLTKLVSSSPVVFVLQAGAVVVAEVMGGFLAAVRSAVRPVADIGLSLSPGALGWSIYLQQYRGKLRLSFGGSGSCRLSSALSGGSTAPAVAVILWIPPHAGRS